MTIFQEAVSEKVWDKKYRYRLQEKVIDQTIDDTWHRVAQAVAKAENTKNAMHWQQQFYNVLADFRFLPGGRILAGAGTQHTVTLFNCFVMPIIEDSLFGIFESLKEAAVTLQQGGGVGYDFSILRPRGYPVLQAGRAASGPVSFMRIWDSMCATMESTSVRSGVMMGILRCDHPDIEEFITAKKDSHELKNFNLSVLVSDAFMQCVAEDREWELIFPAQEENVTDTVLRHWSGSAEPVACRIVDRVNARKLWQKMINATALRVLFEDTINRQNNLWYREWISAANPFGETPLPVYGACNLGAINLTQFVRAAFTDQAAVDWSGIEETVRIATRFLDNVIDISHYPLHQQKQEMLVTRRIGLGITGLADMMIMLGISYGSDASLQLAKDIMQRVSHATWQSSIDLAQERGVFAGFHARKYVQGHFAQQLPDELRHAIEKNGIRNSHHNAIAPTSAISLLANNVSPGIGPIMNADHERLVRGKNGEASKHLLTNYAVKLWRKKSGKNNLPPAWVDALQVTPAQQLQMQVAVQPYVDHAVSKTIHLPENFPLNELADIYKHAYQLGLKGCAVNK